MRRRRPKPRGCRCAQLTAERRGVDQGIARRTDFDLAGAFVDRCGRLRFLVDRIDFLRTQPAGFVSAQGIDVDSVIPPRRARISMTMRPLALYVEGRISAMTKSPSYLPSVLLVEFGVLPMTNFRRWRSRGGRR